MSKTKCDVLGRPPFGFKVAVVRSLVPEPWLDDVYRAIGNTMDRTISDARAAVVAVLPPGAPMPAYETIKKLRKGVAPGVSGDEFGF